jgi:hypothetical protein
LVQAFSDEGARDVVNVRTNGTVIFTARDANAVVAGVLERLGRATRYAAPAVARSAAEMVALAEQLDTIPDADEVAFFDATDVPLLELPWIEPKRGHLSILVLSDRYAVTGWTSTTSGSNAATVLGTMLDVAVTCRAIGTVRRVASLLEPVNGDDEVRV